MLHTAAVCCTLLGGGGRGGGEGNRSAWIFANLRKTRFIITTRRRRIIAVICIASPSGHDNADNAICYRNRIVHVFASELVRWWRYHRFLENSNSIGYTTIYIFRVFLRHTTFSLIPTVRLSRSVLPTRDGVSVWSSSPVSPANIIVPHSRSRYNRLRRFCANWCVWHSAPYRGKYNYHYSRPIRTNIWYPTALCFTRPPGKTCQSFIYGPDVLAGGGPKKRFYSAYRHVVVWVAVGLRCSSHIGRQYCTTQTRIFLWTSPNPPLWTDNFETRLKSILSLVIWLRKLGSRERRVIVTAREIVRDSGQWSRSPPLSRSPCPTGIHEYFTFK